MLTALLLSWGVSARGASFDVEALAAPSNLRVDHWGMEEGLQQGTVTSVALDDQGELWVGTFGGLHRFTGAGFVPVVAAPEHQAKLARISALEVGEGGVWVGTAGNGVWRLEAGVVSRPKQPDSVADMQIRALRSAPDGSLLVVSDDFLYRRTSGGQWLLVDDSHSLDVLELDDGSILLAQNSGLVMLWSNGERQELLSGRSIYGLRADPGGNVWIQGLDGIWILRAGESEVTRSPWLERCPYGVGPAIDTGGHVWVPTSGGVMDLGRWDEVLELFSQGEVPVASRVSTGADPRALVVDPSGQRWVGVVGRGLVRISELPYTKYELPPGMGSISLGPIAGRGEDTWVAVDCSNFVRLSTDGVQEIRSKRKVPGTLGHCVRSMAIDANGGIWFGQRGGLYAPDGDGWQRLAPVGSPFEMDEEVHPLVFDADGSLWAGTSSGRVMRKRPGGPLEDLPFPSEGGEPLSFAFAADTTWVGTSTGLVRIPMDGAPSLMRPEDGLPFGPVRDVALDDEGVVWVVTYGGGLGWVDGDDVGRLGQEVVGMPDEFLSSVVPVSDGGLWLHGNRGLHFLRRQDIERARTAETPTLVSVRYDVGGANGWNRPAHWIDAEKSLWAVTLDDVVRFPLTVDHAPVVAGLARITEVRAKDARFPVTGGDVEIPVRLGRTIGFAFTSPPLGPDSLPSYRYRLRSPDHPDPPWTLPSPGTSARFEDLSPGTHTFEVQTVGMRASMGPVASVRVQIPIQLSEDPTMWAVALGVVIIGAAVVVGLRLFVLGGRNRQLEQEIHQRRQAEGTAQLRERQYKQLFEAAGHGLLLFSERGVCSDANSEAERIFRVHGEVLIGMQRDELGLGGDALSRIQCRRPDGSQFPAQVATSRHEEAGRRMVLVSVVDLSELLEAREAERQLRGQLESARRIESLGRLAGGVAHDMNNLLAAIIGNAELMREDNLDDDSGQVRDPDIALGIDEILDASARGARLIEQLMSMGRRDSSPPSDISIDDTLHAMAGMLRRILPDNVQLEMEVCTRMALRASQASLEQVVLNLVMNASDAMPGGGRLSVMGSVCEDGHTVELIVRDSGEGIAPELIEHIFEPFVTSKGIGEGTGLGLATVRDIVKNVGGTIAVESVRGEGASFIMRLPAVPLEEASQLVHVAAEAEGERAGRQVLVVDDNDALRRTVVGTLRKNGMVVVDFGDPVEALDWLSRTQPRLDLMVSDVVMPGLDGRSLADRVRESYALLPVLFISGYTGDVVLRHGVDGQREALLRKPFSRDALLSAIDAILREAKAVAALSPRVDDPLDGNGATSEA